MRSVERLLVAVLASAALTSMSSLAFAESRSGSGDSKSAGAYVDGSGNPTAEARNAQVAPGRPVTSGGTSRCTWEVINADDTAVAMYDADGTRLKSETGRWLQKTCDGRQEPVNGAFAVPERNRPPVDPAVLAQQARESVAIPAPPMSTSPQADRQLYTRVRTWLWVDPAWWRSYSATANAGGVSTTVSARPVRAVWSMGDGATVTCDGPGTVWGSGLPDDGTSCSYEYKNSSAGRRDNAYTMTVTVEFAVSWTSTIGSGGTLAPLTRSVSRPVQVGEIQAIETQ